MQSNITPAQSAVKSPAVSIIIPLYNAEKFIGELLDSLLEQTLKNFEVIVFDDCSTDSSCEIVESYIPKFDGRLSLCHMSKNSGSAPAPRNNGFLVSRGEYIFFMDSDDTLTQTALEEMYSLAKEYDADVVYCERYYMSTGIGEEYVKNIHIADDRIQKPPFVTKPTLISENLADRLDELIKRKFWVTPWQRLVSRKLLAENEITFPEIIGCDDVVWCFLLLCFAKRFLRVPNMCYVRRMYEESFTQSSKKSPNKHIHQWLDIAVRGLKFVNKFMDRLEFFRENADYRYKAISCLANPSFGVITPICSKLNPEEIYNIFIKEFTKDTGENNVLVAFLFTRIIEYMKSKRVEKKPLKLKPNIPKYNRLTADQEKAIEQFKTKIADFLSSQKTIPALNSNSPAISVVIPMYNAEEYIKDCLNSLLVQTFQDFEVIVADDCSTDNSIAVVASYAPKFNGRLKLAKMKKNSGGGGYIPRNVGLSISRGEYVIFLDADDFLLDSALETLYNAAKEYDAEVVYSSTYYNVPTPEEVYLYRDGFARNLLREGLEDNTTFSIDDRDKIFKEFVAPGTGEGNFRAPWSKFVRRDFLLENKILFPDIVTGGDCVWCVDVYAHARKFLRLPTPLYFYRRYNVTSITRTQRNFEEQLSYWVEAFVAYLKALNAIQNKADFLKKNPFYCYETVRGGHFEWVLNRTNSARNNLSNEEIYKILYNELNKEKDLRDFTVPFFFSAIDYNEKDFNKKLNQLRQFLPTARLDIKFVPKTNDGDFQIVSLSDDKADIRTPDWLQKDGVGYQIQSCGSSMDIVFKVTSDGQIRLNLMGLDVRDPKDHTKRIPSWIDYTYLTINEKNIFNDITPAWHDKPYRHNFDVKAGDEITLKVEWLPHRKTIRENATPTVSKKFLPHLTARLDMQLKPEIEGGDLKIISVSDKKATILAPNGRR